MGMSDSQRNIKRCICVKDRNLVGAGQASALKCLQFGWFKRVEVRCEGRQGDEIMGDE